jgi:hypothetical protein
LRELALLPQRRLGLGALNEVRLLVLYRQLKVAPNCRDELNQTAVLISGVAHEKDQHTQNFVTGDDGHT